MDSYQEVPVLKESRLGAEAQAETTDYMSMSSTKTESIVDSVSPEMVLVVTEIKVEPQEDFIENYIVDEQDLADDDVTHTNITVHLLKSDKDEVVIRSSAVKIEPLDDTDSKWFSSKDNARTSIKVEVNNDISKIEPFVSENINIPDVATGNKTDDLELPNHLLGNTPKMPIVKLQPIIIGNCDNCDKQFYYVPKKGVNSGKTGMKCELCENEFIVLNILGHRSWFSNEISERYDSTNSFLKGGDIPSHFIETTLLSYGIGSAQPIFNSDFNKKATDGILYTSKYIEKPHQCNFCDKRFTRKDHLIRHNKYHAGIKPFKCDVCYKTFSLKEYLTKHNLRIHIDTKRVRCEICRKIFNFEANLQDHMKTHFNEKQFECYVCDRKYYKKAHLKRHMKFHSGLKPYKCEFCCKMFVLQEDLTKHIRIHTELKPNKCAVCDKIFDDESVLQEHMMQCHDKAKPYECEVCQKSYKRKKNLHLHMKYHSDKKQFQCDFCDKSYYINQCLKRHMKSHTGEDKPYKCDIRNKEYALKSHLEHKTQHNGKGLFSCNLDDEKISTLVNQYKKTKARALPFQCNICKKKFSFKVNYTNHLKIHTHVLRPFQCDLCNKGFFIKRDLIRHLVTHTKDKPFKCNTCGKTFAVKASHEYHMLRHAGEKPNQCDICDKKFTTKGELTVHWKYHTGENLFKCHVCGKKFIKNYDCQRHIKTHSGEKPFKCNLCETRFTTKTAQMKHFKTQHPKE